MMLLLLVALGAFWTAFVLKSGATAATTGPIVLVSGRDDHGLLAQATVPLSQRPGQTGGGAVLADATFARVLDERGEWLYIQSIANPQAAGWINDYYLRNRALWLDHGVQVTFVDARQLGARLEIAVRPIDGTHDVTWVATDHLLEVGARDQPHRHDHQHTP
jgi:hypothetical protein